MLKFCISLSSLLCSSLVFSGSMGDVADTSKGTAFVGLGGAYNSIQVKQDLYAIGVASYAGALSGVGIAQGPAAPFYGTTSVFSPEIQTGWYKNFTNSNRLWGLKFSYQYLGAAITHTEFTALQLGTIDGKTLVGNLLIGSAQTIVNHELLLLPFIGHSFKKSQLYLGVGPALFGTRSNINSATGFANLSGSPSDITGIPANFTDSAWVWGGAAQAGFSYFPAPEWSIDVTYTYAISGQYDTNVSEPFTHSMTSPSVTVTGTGYINTNQNIMAQALTLTINKLFSI